MCAGGQHLLLTVFTGIVCGTSYRHVHAVHIVLKLLTVINAIAVASAVVLSSLDYCNPLLYGTAEFN
jgi:hypothetical protein